MLKRTLLLLVLIVLCAPTTFAAKRKRVEPQTITTPVYDTIRVVVTDTIRVEPKPAPRIDTLMLAHTPVEIDSLVEAWSVLHQAQSEKEFFGLFNAEDSVAVMPIDTLYKRRLADMASPMHLPYNYIVRNFINQRKFRLSYSHEDRGNQIQRYFIKKEETKWEQNTLYLKSQQ